MYKNYIWAIRQNFILLFPIDFKTCVHLLIWNFWKTKFHMHQFSIFMTYLSSTKNFYHFGNFWFISLSKVVSFPGIIVLLVAISNSYVWLVVYSAYKSLETKKGLTHVLHGVKKKPAVPVVKKSKAVKAGANKPFEV